MSWITNGGNSMPIRQTDTTANSPEDETTITAYEREDLISVRFDDLRHRIYFTSRNGYERGYAMHSDAYRGIKHYYETDTPNTDRNIRMRVMGKRLFDYAYQGLHGVTDNVSNSRLSEGNQGTQEGRTVAQAFGWSAQPTRIEDMSYYQLGGSFNVDGYRDNSIMDSTPINQDAIDFPSDLKCTTCESKITHPQWIVNYLGYEECKKYIKVCKDANMPPQVYCCTCFSFAQKDSRILKKYKETVQMYIKASEVHRANLDKELELQKRERELDEAIAKIERKQKGKWGIFK